jgi:translation initiation factor eIF-2B subunit delta
MDAPLRLDALVAPLRADVVSGAAVVARMAAEVVRRAAGRVSAGSVSELRAALADVGILALDAQPAMAPLVALVRDVLEAIDGVPDVDSGRIAARKACDAFREGLETRAHVVASRASGLLPRQGDILTLSSSSTVRGILLHHAHRRQGRVIVLESRPMQEGRMLAAALAEVGVPVLFAVDAAAATLVRGCAAVLLGADSLGDLGVVNKLGSLGAAQAAREAGVPVLVATDETKILPPGFPQPVADERPADEVWRAPADVRVWNRYFEAVPLHMVSSIVTESATLTPAEVEDLRKAIRVPDEIRAWAAAQASPETGPGEPM